MSKKRTTQYKVALFKSVFQGLNNVYGTYRLDTGKYRQVKENITDNTIYLHLKGEQPYGFYPLTGKITRVGVADFDEPDPEKALGFYHLASDWGLPTYIEKSKSKGHHVWMFFSEQGISAKKVRIVIRWLLEEANASSTEIFPKQDEIQTKTNYGNFINAPLFGKLVLDGKTVFLNSDNLNPFKDQWDVLENIMRISADQLDDLIKTEIGEYVNHENRSGSPKGSNHRYSLPICIRRILEEGVTFDQRVACFRLAVHLKRVGIPYETAIEILKTWSMKNIPIDNKGIITSEEIESQTKDGYKGKYTGYGCYEPIIKEYCDPQCPVRRSTNGK